MISSFLIPLAYLSRGNYMTKKEFSSQGIILPEQNKDTKRTTLSYQEYYNSEVSIAPEDGVYEGHYPVHLWGGGELGLPLQRLKLSTINPDLEDIGIALLMTSHLEHRNLHLLAERMQRSLQQHEIQTGQQIDAIAGIAKLGYSIAQRISELMGHERWVPIDSGQKLWYDNALSGIAASITSAGTEKRMYIDPSIQQRVYGRTIAVVDDAINTGGSTRGAVEALRNAGANNILVAPLFTEGHDWQSVLENIDIDPYSQLVRLGHLPIFTPLEDNHFVVKTETL